MSKKHRRRTPDRIIKPSEAVNKPSQAEALETGAVISEADMLGAKTIDMPESEGNKPSEVDTPAAEGNIVSETENVTPEVETLDAASKPSEAVTSVAEEIVSEAENVTPEVETLDAANRLPETDASETEASKPSEVDTPESEENIASETEVDTSEGAPEADKSAEKRTKGKRSYKEKFEFTTPMNDPDLEVGPYKPIEGEPQTIKCPNCGEEMPTTIDTCVNCGHYLKREDRRYKPMSEAKAKKIRWTIGIICIVIFIIWFIVFKTAN